MPLTKHRGLFLQVLVIIIWIFALSILGWIGYDLYAYFAFNALARTYPDSSQVPNDQVDTYFWLRTLHDMFLPDLFKMAGPFLTCISQIYALFSTAQTELIVCTEGMLKKRKKLCEAVRWDEVDRVYLTNGRMNRFVKNDGSTFSLANALVTTKIHTWILDEVTRQLLPGMVERYMRGEIITFDDLEVNQQGIARTGQLIEWQYLGAISLAGQELSLFYSEPELESLSSAPGIGKWHTWRKRKMRSETWPNLPLLVALVETILEQRGEHKKVQAPHALPSETLKETALRLKQRGQRRQVITIASIALSIACLCSLFLGVVIFQSNQEQQQAERAKQALRNHFIALAHTPYSVHVPGEHCGDGGNFWLDDDSQNSYICQPDGLLMTQKNRQYEDGEWLTFVPDQLSADEDFSSAIYFPHHYQVQVQVNILSGGPDTCVGLEFHVQHFEGRQSFDLCADGSWAAYHCDASCETFYTLMSGNLPSAKTAYLMMVDVTDTGFTLMVDHTQVASVNDNTYTATNQLKLVLYGNKDAPEPISARFSDFAYRPL